MCGCRVEIECIGCGFASFSVLLSVIAQAKCFFLCEREKKHNKEWGMGTYLCIHKRKRNKKFAKEIKICVAFEMIMVRQIDRLRWKTRTCSCECTDLSILSIRQIEWLVWVKSEK